MKKENYEFIINNFFTIDVSTTEKGIFAFHLFKKDKVIQKIGYKKNQGYSFKNLRPGNYRVKVFKKTNSEIKTIISNNLLIRNLSQTDSNSLDFILDAPNYDLEWISSILEETHNIGRQNYRNNQYRNHHEYEKSNINFDDENYKILTTDSSHRYDAKYVYISLSHNSDNPLNEFLSRKSVIDLYRISQSLYKEGFEKGAHYIWMYMRKNSACSLSYKTLIGKNFRLGLGGINTIIHPKSIIGNNVKIAQQVTIGFSGGSELSGPIIGDNVYIAPGAMCLGGKIGSNVMVASNSVVLDEVPSNCVVAGAPAKVISTNMEKYKHFLK